MVSNDIYFKSVSMMERVDRLFQEAVKVELDNLGIKDINSVQAIILYNIGERIVSIGDIIRLGFYKGTNSNYNLKSLIQNKYIIQSVSFKDMRRQHIRLSKKGLELYAKLHELFRRQESIFFHKYIQRESVVDLQDTLLHFDNFLTNVVRGEVNV